MKLFNSQINNIAFLANCQEHAEQCGKAGNKTGIFYEFKWKAHFVRATRAE